MNNDATKTSLYLALGFFLSHLFHAHTYWSQGGKELATWLTHVSPVFSRSFGLALFLAVCLAVFTLAMGILLHREFSRRSIPSVLGLSAGVLTFLLVASQTITSSVMRIFYEAGFASVFISSVIVQKVFLTPARAAPLNKELYERLWDLLRLSIPLVLGFSAVFGGVGAISSFYDTPQEFIHRQMYRHLYLTAYFACGMGLFVMWPIFRQILTMHWSLYVEGKENGGQQTSAPDTEPARSVDSWPVT